MIKINLFQLFILVVICAYNPSVDKLRLSLKVDQILLDEIFQWYALS